MSSASVFTLHAQLDADTLAVGELGLCSVRLMNDATYPWLILVPRVSDASELIDLSDAQQGLLMRELSQCSRVVQQQFQPDKLNVAALGNMVPQLHVHLIARFIGDAAWPAPVWGKAPAQPYSEAAAEALLGDLRRALALA